MNNFHKHLHNQYGFTIVDNKIFIEKKLDLRAIGLLIQLLSLPDDWKYSIKGLAKICKDGEASIAAGLEQLKKHGYLTVERYRNENGKLGGSIYHIYENPEDNLDYKKSLEETILNECTENNLHQEELAEKSKKEPQLENQADLSHTHNITNKYTKDDMRDTVPKPLDIIDFTPELENPVLVNLSEKQNSQPKLKKPEQVKPGLEKPNLEKPGLENHGQYSKYNKINNNIYNKGNNNINNNNKKIYSEINESGKLNRVVENMVDIGLLRSDAERYIADYGLQRAQEVISAANSPKIKNKAGWIISAFEKRYICAASAPDFENEKSIIKNDYTESYASACEYTKKMSAQTGDPNWRCPSDYPSHGLIITPFGMATMERAKEKFMEKGR